MSHFPPLLLHEDALIKRVLRKELNGIQIIGRYPFSIDSMVINGELENAIFNGKTPSKKKEI